MEITMANTLSLARLGGATFRCDLCGTHTAATKELVLGVDVLGDMAAYVKTLLGGAGRVLLAAGGKSYECGGNLAEKALTDAGIVADTRVITRQEGAARALAAAVADDTRAVVAVGGGTLVAAAKRAADAKRVPVIVVPTTPAADDFLAPYAYVKTGGFWEKVAAAPPVAVFADLTVLSGAPTSHFAAAFGLVVSKAVAATDGKFAFVMKGGAYCEAMSGLSAACIDAAMDAAPGLIRHERRAVGVVTEQTLRLSLYRQLAPGHIAVEGGAELQFSMLAAERLRVTARAPRLHGERCLLGAEVLLRLYRLFLSGIKSDVLPPPNILARAERYAAFTEREEHKVLKSFESVPDPQTYALLFYKLKEYREELLALTESAQRILDEGGRCFRHIYPDAGYWRKKYLTGADYKGILALASDPYPQYTLLHFMRDLGYMDAYLPGASA
ncbi:MAG: iron-containing alcohol dehydrogenase [Clostridiales bacterium]|jgi:glycerol-1-phosphate dehydrogenase [NAD(P)+]|nr:iron-containing alcohol dehydrogenase [Clostridiales bacterium]